MKKKIEIPEKSFNFFKGKKKVKNEKQKTKTKRERERNQSKESVLDRKCGFCLAKNLLCFVDGGVKR